MVSTARLLKRPQLASSARSYASQKLVPGGRLAMLGAAGGRPIGGRPPKPGPLQCEDRRGAHPRGRVLVASDRAPGACLTKQPYPGPPNPPGGPPRGGGMPSCRHIGPLPLRGPRSSPRHRPGERSRPFQLRRGEGDRRRRSEGEGERRRRSEDEGERRCRSEGERDRRRRSGDGERRRRSVGDRDRRWRSFGGDLDRRRGLPLRDRWRSLTTTPHQLRDSLYDLA